MIQFIITGIIFILSVVFGILIGILLFKLHKINNIKYHGPNSSKFKNKIYKKNGKCYVFKPHIYICPLL
jgi:hypothetical protein